MKIPNHNNNLLTCNSSIQWHFQNEWFAYFTKNLRTLYASSFAPEATSSAKNIDKSTLLNALFIKYCIGLINTRTAFFCFVQYLNPIFKTTGSRTILSKNGRKIRKKRESGNKDRMKNILKLKSFFKALQPLTELVAKITITRLLKMLSLFSLPFLSYF